MLLHSQHDWFDGGPGENIISCYDRSVFCGDSANRRVSANSLMRYRIGGICLRSLAKSRTEVD